MWFPELCAFLTTPESARGYGWHIGAAARSGLFSQDQTRAMCEAVTRNLQSREERNMLDYAQAYALYWAFIGGVKDAQPQS
jgi:hypothetical protein